MLRRGRGLLGGAGAGANNAALTLGLSQLGELLVVDFDHYETHNATRSPFYPTGEEIKRWGRAKARVLAEKVAGVSRAVPGVSGSRTRYRVGYVQELSASVFGYVDFVLNGADNQAARAFLAEHAFLAGKPFIDAGFRGTLLRIGVFVPQDPARDPCWRCRYPDYVVNDERWYSCLRFARAVEQQGLVPAVQATAQVAGALQAAHALQALHGESTRSNSVLSLDILRGDSSSFRAVRNPRCPSRWHDLADRPARLLPWTAEQTWNDLLDRANRMLGAEVQLEPLARIVESMRCLGCQRLMDVHAQAWLYEAVPRCAGCDGLFPLLPEGERSGGVETSYEFVDFTRIDLLHQTLSAFRVAAGSVFLARPFGERTADPTVIRLDGPAEPIVDGLFTTVPTA